jgi:hypothetical protein
MVDSNYELARRHYSYDVLRRQLGSFSLNLFNSSDSSLNRSNIAHMPKACGSTEKPALARLAV